MPNHITLEELPMLARLTADAESYAKQIESIRSRRAELAAEIEQIKLQEAAAAKVYEYIQQLLQSVTDKPADNPPINTVTDNPATTTSAPKLSMTPAAIAAREKRARKRTVVPATDTTPDTAVPNV